MVKEPGQNNYPQSWREHDRKVAPYLWGHRGLHWASRVVGFGFLYALIFEGQGEALAYRLGQGIGSPFLHWLAFFAVVGLAWEVISFPFSVASHWLEREYRLSRQNYRSWLGDRFKGLAVGAVFGTFALALLYWAQRLWPETWWFWAATGMVLFSILLAQLAPVLLIPLFFKLKPMADGSLKQRLLDLCRREGVDVREVYHLGMGDKTEKGNAAFTGLGRTKRILIGDTLYERYRPEEVEAVFAHELGHQVHNDLWKGIGLSAVVVYVTFFLADLICTQWWLPAVGTDLADPYGLFLFFIAVSLIQLPLGSLQAAWSRHRERLADRYAAETVGVPQPLADALEKLTYQNHSLFRPHPLRERLTFSHPAPWRRILGLREVSRTGVLAE